MKPKDLYLKLYKSLDIPSDHLKLSLKMKAEREVNRQVKKHLKNRALRVAGKMVVGAVADAIFKGDDGEAYENHVAEKKRSYRRKKQEQSDNG